MRNTFIICTIIAAAGVFLLIGCQSTDVADSGSANSSNAVTSSKGAAQLWAENCTRCHNARSPASLSDAQWDVAVHHMRVRANLLPQEQVAIVKFLKAGN